MTRFDAAVVGTGPNGLTAAAVLSAAGLSVVALEAASHVGGGASTEWLTLPGFAHDVCSAVHPMAAVSPVFKRLQLDRAGLAWMSAPKLLAHPFDDGDAVVLERSVDETAAGLDEDGAAWRRLVRPFVDRQEALFAHVLRPAVQVPTRPWLMARFGWLAGRSSDSLVAERFTTRRARALFGGCAAHSTLSLDALGSASFGLVLAIAGHASDWPCARGGSQQIAEALARIARGHGCEIRTDTPIRSLRDVPASRVMLFDVTPRQLDALASSDLSASYRRRLCAFRYGPGVFKVDYALAGPIPWRALACKLAMTVHVGGTYEEIARGEKETAIGRIPDKPFVLVAQQSRFDPGRAPAGQHTGWAYCHVPHGSTVDMTDRIERQIERFAPGFRALILARHVMAPAALEARNHNLVGGNISGGANTLDQFLFRPFPRWNPYATSNPRLFLCSSSTPPGAGVHGMCGYWAARTALRRVFQRDWKA